MARIDQLKEQIESIRLQNGVEPLSSAQRVANLVVAAEISTGLSKQGEPVELDHTPFNTRLTARGWEVVQQAVLEEYTILFEDPSLGAEIARALRPSGEKQAPSKPIRVLMQEAKAALGK